MIPLKPQGEYLFTKRFLDSHKAIAGLHTDLLEGRGSGNSLKLKSLNIAKPKNKVAGGIPVLARLDFDINGVEMVQSD